jgi:D-sedoheptulose 7-phosphate isomerase
MNEADIRRLAAESAALKQRFFEEKAALLLAVGRRMAASLRAGGKVLAFGNGGSAADAQHLAAELVGRFLRERAAWPALALSTDTSVLTAVGNDLGYESVFRRQVEAHGRPGDVAIGITTSGRSANVLAALRVARERGLITIALTGDGGGEAKALADHLIDVPHRETARVQEVHAMVIHVLCQVVEEELVQG